MAKCIVIGGGFAGLASAAYLTKAGIKVELLESSPKLGGRAYSFKDESSGSIIDNGQHIMMGCYTETLDFMKLIGAGDNLRYQDKLKINFVKEGFKVLALNASRLPYPFNLIAGLLNYKAISPKERISLLRFFLKLPFQKVNEIKKLTVREFLLKENQSENAIKAFWAILVVGALNTSMEKASAEIFLNILKRIFLSGNAASAIVLPKYGLSETYCVNAGKFIAEGGGIINMPEGVTGFIYEGMLLKKIITAKRIIDDFDFVISAVPFFAAEKIKNFSLIVPHPGISFSPILSVHVWLKENKFKDDFYGLIGSEVHWIFNRGDHITLVISDAGRFIDKERGEISELVINELQKFAYIKKEEIISIKIIKEKRATFIPTNDINGKRPGTKTNLSNFFLAGDWIDTGLPSTIESAVKSGRLAAEMILKNLKA